MDNRPRPPEDFDGETLLEWERVCDELSSLGTLHTSDRAILTQYCTIWTVNRIAAKHVGEYGQIVKWHNGVPGPNPFYKDMIETTKLLRGLLADLGLTPAARAAAAAPAKAEDDEANEKLDF